MQKYLGSSSSSSNLTAVRALKNMLVASWVSFHARSWNYSGSNCITACGCAVFPYQVPVSKQLLMLGVPCSSGLYASASGPSASMSPLLLDLANSCTLADRSNVAAALSSLSDHIIHSDSIVYSSHHAAALACTFLIEVIQTIPPGLLEGLVALIMDTRNLLLSPTSSSSFSIPESANQLPSLSSILAALSLHLRSWGDSASPSAINATMAALAMCYKITSTLNASSYDCGTLLVCVGLARLHLTLPILPIDPSAKFRVKASALLASASEIQCLSSSTVAVASAVTAFISGALERVLSVSFNELATAAAVAQRDQVERPVPDAFELLFSDLYSISTSLCSLERMMQICPIVMLQV
jgi:hypothetical protein